MLKTKWNECEKWVVRKIHSSETLLWILQTKKIMVHFDRNFTGKMWEGVNVASKLEIYYDSY